MRQVLSIVALMVVGALIIGLVTHAKGTAQVINSVTGFFRTGLAAQLGQVPQR
jgi:hypothetical protein